MVGWAGCWFSCHDVMGFCFRLLCFRLDCLLLWLNSCLCLFGFGMLYDCLLVGCLNCVVCVANALPLVLVAVWICW